LSPRCTCIYCFVRLRLDKLFVFRRSRTRLVSRHKLQTSPPKVQTPNFPAKSSNSKLPRQKIQTRNKQQPSTSQPKRRTKFKFIFLFSYLNSCFQLERFSQHFSVEKKKLPFSSRLCANQQNVSFRVCRHKITLFFFLALFSDHQHQPRLHQLSGSQLTFGEELNNFAQISFSH